MNSIKVSNKTIRRTDDGLISLTDLYAAALSQGQADSKLDPRRWAAKASRKTSGTSQKVSVSGGPGLAFIEAVAGALNVNASDILKATRGKGGGTYAHWQIALAYAKYLSPQLHMQVNDVYARAKSGDVTLADEIADKASAEQQEWLLKRMQGKVARSRLTATLKDHGVTGQGYGRCTNAIYRPILGGTKSEVCRANGIEPSRKVSLRDLMSIEQLTATAMAELVAAKQITKFNAHGNARCESECDRAARNVAALLQ